MELKNNGKINFIIDLFLDLDTQISGGLIALHKLAYELANMGHNVYIFCKPNYPHKNITTITSNNRQLDGHKYEVSWEPFSFNYENTVAIYPEHALGNKFYVKNIVRWVMYHTTTDEESYFTENEYIFNYGNFKTNFNREDGKLKVVDYNLDLFYNENKKRKGFCHIFGKETPNNYESILGVFNSVDITNYKEKTDLNLLRQEFNKYEYFLTFDQKTYLSAAAALCGCKTIILKNDISSDILPVEYRLENPEFMFGVAYGIEDLSWAEKTIHLVRDHITNLDKTNQKSVKNFITFWENKLKINKL